MCVFLLACVCGGDVEKKLERVLVCGIKQLSCWRERGFKTVIEEKGSRSDLEGKIQLLL